VLINARRDLHFAHHPDGDVITRCASALVKSDEEAERLQAQARNKPFTQTCILNPPRYIQEVEIYELYLEICRATGVHFDLKFHDYAHREIVDNEIKIRHLKRGEASFSSIVCIPKGEEVYPEADDSPWEGCVIIEGVLSQRRPGQPPMVQLAMRWSITNRLRIWRPWHELPLSEAPQFIEAELEALYEKVEFECTARRLYRVAFVE
jgi:hypothetical protein